MYSPYPFRDRLYPDATPCGVILGSSPNSKKNRVRVISDGNPRRSQGAGILNWIGSSRPGLGWRGVVAQCGVHFVAIPLIGCGLAFAFIAIEVSSPAQQREWWEISKAFTLKSTGKTILLTKKQEERMVRFGSVSSGAITSTVSILGLSLGFGLLFSKNWARLMLIFISVSLMVAWSWALVSNAPALSSPWSSGAVRLARDLILTQWKTLAVVLFLLWPPTRTLFQHALQKGGR